jgi:uncharacterized repeat protein (TIGR03803 family)
MTKHRLSYVLGLCFTVVSVATAVIVHANPTVRPTPVESLLWSFFQGSDGGRPLAPLIAGKTNTLYGTTSKGGGPKECGIRGGCGTVFKLTASGRTTERQLWVFGNGPDGGFPDAGLVADAAGTLYGTTQLGGATNLGTAFALVPMKTGYRERVLWNFGGPKDGALPQTGLIVDAHGTLYGATQFGGACKFDRCGVVFTLTPSGSSYKERVIYRFRGRPDGAEPDSNLIVDTSGALYGTTALGGHSNAGTVFRLTPSRSGYRESVLWSFDQQDGVNPTGVVADATGTLYGTTYGAGSHGGGTVFSLTRSGTSYSMHVLWSFGQGSDGSHPLSGLLVAADGALLGTTSAGGPKIGCGGVGCGTVFELVPSGSSYEERILWTFGGPDGATPVAGLLTDGTGALYGTVQNGGVHGRGAVFKLIPASP